MDTPRSWRIDTPWSVPPVKPNGGHANRYAHAKKVRDARTTFGLLARKHLIPQLDRCRVELVWQVPDRIARDVDNLAWTLKPICDALAGRRPLDHQIVPNDTPEWMEKPMPRIDYRPGEPKLLYVIVTELPA